jgi:hypothetical protein
MTLRIEDYALIVNMHTAALVGIDGSVEGRAGPGTDAHRSDPAFRLRPYYSVGRATALRLARDRRPRCGAVRSPIDLSGEDFRTVGEFEVAAGQSVGFVMTRYASHTSEPRGRDPAATLRATEAWWRQRSERCSMGGPWARGRAALAHRSRR